MSLSEKIDAYSTGARLVRDAVSGMSPEELLARPVAGRWNTREVVCHLADTETVYAERMKRVIAETDPPLLAMDPDTWMARLAIDRRDIEEELRLIEIQRAQMTRLLGSLKAEDFQRRGIHSEAGPLTLESLLERVTKHIPHHVRFITEKRAALKK